MFFRVSYLRETFPLTSLFFFSFKGNCAHFHKGGWWYNTCAHSNLNGVWYRGGHYRSKHQDGIFWAEYRGGSYSLRAVQMMIKPIDWRGTVFQVKWHRTLYFSVPRNVNVTCILLCTFISTVSKMNFTILQKESENVVPSCFNIPQNTICIHILVEKKLHCLGIDNIYFLKCTYLPHVKQILALF